MRWRESGFGRPDREPNLQVGHRQEGRFEGWTCGRGVDGEACSGHLGADGSVDVPDGTVERGGADQLVGEFPELRLHGVDVRGGNQCHLAGVRERAEPALQLLEERAVPAHGDGLIDDGLDVEGESEVGRGHLGRCTFDPDREWRIQQGSLDLPDAERRLGGRVTADLQPGHDDAARHRVAMDGDIDEIERYGHEQEPDGRDDPGSA